MDIVWQKYQIALTTNPIRTKACTSAFMSMLGEILGQYLAHNKSFRISFQRLLVSGVYGGIITGPLMHWWYRILEKAVPNTSNYIVLKKILLDRLLFTPPFLTLTIFSLQVLNGISVSAATAHLRSVFLTALVMNWKVWTTTQWMSFTFVPARFRVLWGNLIAVWWNCYLSLTHQ